MMKLKFLTIPFLALTTLVDPSQAAQNAHSVHGDHMSVKELREAVRLYDIGMRGRSKTLLEKVAREYGSADAKGYAVLCDVVTSAPGYEVSMNDFLEECPYSKLVPQIRYRHALNLFHNADYASALSTFEMLKPGMLYKSDRTEYLFDRAYCNLELQQYDTAYERFAEVHQLPFSDYTGPSAYAMGYIRYVGRDFQQALSWFEKSVKDNRFTAISNWYIMECRFMMKDYVYVTNKGAAMYEVVPQERKPYLARLISESYLVLGDADNAKKYLDMHSSNAKSRSDWFHSGSVMYAVGDYSAAIEHFNMMGERRDSLGQIANYQLGYSYIKSRNKVAAMAAFKDAASVSYDANITDDAYFNYAKLAFDLNDDSSVFNAYMQKYPNREKDDRINSYMAVAALHKRDYAGAIEAYDRIDYLNTDMKDNYMKANYLRARQMVENGAFRGAVPYLEASAYYAGKGTRFSHLSRYWIAESYFRDGQYAKARSIYVDLYNMSALYNSPEGNLITYNLAYCYFMENDYANALKWFDRYLEESSVTYRKDALERKGDCWFVTKKYKNAASSYALAVSDYFNADDVYPYYQAAMSYGLSGDKDKKVELLEYVRNAKPGVPYYGDALYELGRCYISANQDEKAFECFEILSKNQKDGNHVAKAYLEMGSIERNRGNFDAALAHYQIVVEQLPMSGYEEDALLAIENIYRAKNQSEEYVAYIERIGKGASKTEEEKEDLVFNSAEQVFLSDNYQKALSALKSYLEKYPNGRNLYKANFYLAESYRALDMKEQACDCYEIVIEGGQSAFVEVSMLNYAALSYRLERWDDAEGGYGALYESAKIDENRFLAKVGIMRSAFKGRKFDKSLQYAKTLVEDHRSDPALKQEASYVIAKSYMAQSQRDEALAVLTRLSEDKSTIYGAEAAYMLIVDSYDRGEFQEVEDRVYAFSDSASGQTYWLAKSFIVLGDSFADRGEFKQAKATFESIKNEYTGSADGDDVLESVNLRLLKLDTMMNKN